MCDLTFERGEIFYPVSGSIDWVRGDHLMVAPPFVITEKEIDDVVDVLREAVNAGTINEAVLLESSVFGPFYTIRALIAQ